MLTTREDTLRVDALHRRLAHDVRVMYDAVSDAFPARMPKHFEQRSCNIRHFIDNLNEVCEPFNVFNEIKDDPNQAVGTIITSGIWIADSELPENGSEADARVLWHMNPATKRFQWTRYHWNRRRFYFWQLMMHELIHRHQPTSNTGREPRVYRTDADTRELKEQQEYYGNYEEIETHAHDAALEFFVWWPDLTLRQCMAAAWDVKAPTPPTFLLFMQAFLESPKHPAVAHFKRKLSAWFDMVHKNANFYSGLQLAKII